MKKVLIFILSLWSISAFSQTYNPTNFIVVNSSLGPAQAVPTDGRSQFYDGTNFVMRDYNGTGEVLSYLNLGKYRFGHFPVYVHFGGTLTSGVWSGGITQTYFFKNGTADSNLVIWNTDATNSRLSQDTTFRINDSTIGFTINGGPTRSFIIRGTAGGGISSLSLTTPTALFSSPITFGNSGGAWTGAMVLNNQSANTIFAGPTVGSPAQPTFRGLVTADLPSGIPNGNLANSSISFALGTSGTTPAWLTTPVSLGGTATLNVPIANNVNTGFLSNSDWIRFNSVATAAVISVNGQVGAVITKTADSLKGLPIDTTVRRNAYALLYDSTNRKYYFGPAGSGLGTVTAVSSGNISGLATVNVGSPTTTPAFTFTLTPQTQNLIYASPNGSTGTPSFRSLVNADFPTSGISAGTYNTVVFNAQGIATSGSNVAYLTVDTAVVNDLWLTKSKIGNAMFLGVDTAAAGNYFLRRADSNWAYVTQTQFQNALGIQSIYVGPVPPSGYINPIYKLNDSTLYGKPYKVLAPLTFINNPDSSVVFGADTGRTRLSLATYADLADTALILRGLIGGGGVSPGNPTASLGLTAINGTSAAYMRADAAPALSQAITPTWTALHTFNVSPALKNIPTATGTPTILMHSGGSDSTIKQLTIGSGLAVSGGSLTATGAAGSGTRFTNAGYDSSGTFKTGRGYRTYDAVADFNADNTGATDATKQIQAAINACVAGGGGTVYLRNGIYKLSDTLKTAHGNYQIYIPGANPFLTGAIPKVKILGESNQAVVQGGGYNKNTAPTKMNTTGVILRSTISGSGINPGVIGMDTVTSGLNLNFIDIDIENITIETYTNLGTQAPTMSAFMMKNAATYKFKNDVACLDTLTILIPSPQFSNVAGFTCSNQNSGGYNTLDGTMSQGYTYGYVIEGEHTSLFYPIAFQCWYGFAFSKTGYVLTGKILAQACPYSVYARNTPYFGNMLGFISVLDLQVNEEQDFYFAPGTGTPTWYNYKQSINDSSNLLYGKVYWVAADSAGSHTKIQVGGANNLAITQPYQDLRLTGFNISNAGGLNALSLNTGISVTATNANNYANINLVNDQGGVGFQTILGGSTKFPYNNWAVLDNSISSSGIAFGAGSALPLMAVFSSGAVQIKDSLYGATPSLNYSSAVFSVISKTKGSIPAPIMSLATATAISSKQTGLLVTMSDSSSKLAYWNGTKFLRYVTSDELVSGGGGGGGSVTSVATGLGLSGGTITTSGTIIADTSYLMTKNTTQVTTGNKTFGGTINFSASPILNALSTATGTPKILVHLTDSTIGQLGLGSGLSVSGGNLVASGSGGVTTVSNADGTLTISPTSGSVVASLNLANYNAWTNGASFSTTGGLSNGVLISASSASSFATFIMQNDKGGGVAGTGGFQVGIYGSTAGAGKSNNAFFANLLSGGGMLFGAGGGTQRMYIDSTGKVDIGTGFSTGTQLLNLSSGTADFGLTITNTVASQYATLDMFNSSGVQSQIVMEGSSSTTVGGLSSMFAFLGAGTGGTGIAAYNASGIIRFYTAGLASGNLRQSIIANGNILVGSGTTDNAAFFQLPANTTTNAQIFLNGSTADVTSPTNGMLWYNSTAHTLNFRDNGTTTNLLAGGVNFYTTDGTLSSSRTVDASSSHFNLTLGGGTNYLNNLQVNAGNIILTTFNNGVITMSGPVDYIGITSASDANYSSNNDYAIILPVITASRTVTLPTASSNTGRNIILMNRNTSGTFTWSFVNTVKDGAGNTISTLVNGTVYNLISDGTNYIKIN